MNELTIKIPKSAAELMISGELNRNSAYTKFTRNKSIETVVLKTFGMWITDIIRTFDDSSTAVVGHVVYWESGMVTCSRTCGDMSELIGAADFVDENRIPTGDEALELWESFYKEMA